MTHGSYSTSGFLVPLLDVICQVCLNCSIKIRWIKKDIKHIWWKRQPEYNMVTFIRQFPLVFPVLTLCYCFPRILLSPNSWHCTLWCCSYFLTWRAHTHTHIHIYTHTTQTTTCTYTHTSDTACIKFCAFPVNISLASLSAAASEVE